MEEIITKGDTEIIITIEPYKSPNSKEAIELALRTVKEWIIKKKELIYFRKFGIVIRLSTSRGIAQFSAAGSFDAQKAS